MVVMPPGQFLMGSAQEESGRDADEGPRHWVTLSRPFAIGRCEVTRGQFRQFVEETHYRTQAEKSGGCYLWDSEKKQWKQDAKANWERPGFQQDDRHPVVCVSHGDAEAYIAWLVKRTGVAYRLPTESEWEYAARAGTLTSRYWGDDSEQGCEFANGADAEAAKINSSWTTTRCSDGYGYTAPVASFRPNHFGLYDMAGNVLEWVADCYHDNYQGAPDDGSAWGDKPGCNRGVRGGSWDSNPQLLRSAFRNRLRPDGTYDFQGFRLARAL